MRRPCFFLIRTPCLPAKPKSRTYLLLLLQKVAPILKSFLAYVVLRFSKLSPKLSTYWWDTLYKSMNFPLRNNLTPFFLACVPPTLAQISRPFLFLLLIAIKSYSSCNNIQLTAVERFMTSCILKIVFEKSGCKENQLFVYTFSVCSLTIVWLKVA